MNFLSCLKKTFTKDSPTGYSYYYPVISAYILRIRNLIKGFKLIRKYESVSVGKYFNIFSISENCFKSDEKIKMC